MTERLQNLARQTMLSTDAFFVSFGNYPTWQDYFSEEWQCGRVGTD